MRRRSEGQALVEFVLLFPLVLVIILFVIEFGFALYTHITVNSAAREGARYAAVANLPSSTPQTCDGGTIEERTVESSTNVVECDEVFIEYIEQNGDATTKSRGDSVVVRIRHDYTHKTPLVPMLSMITLGTIPSSFQISACADARLEGQPADQGVLTEGTADCGS